MSTRSNIAVEHRNGSVSNIYCHGGGSLDNVGATLLLHYTTTGRVEALLKLGDLSYLGPTLRKTDTFSYRRDKNETCTDARVHDSLAEYIAESDTTGWRDGGGYEYCYVLTRKNGWLVKQGDLTWEPLIEAMVAEVLTAE